MTNSNHICQCLFCNRILDKAHYFCCEMNQSFLDELGYWSPSRLSQYCWKCIEQRKESLAKKELNPKLYCLENNCHAELTNNDQEYCSKHENICPAYACASRNVIVALDYHCFKHKNKCFSTNCFKRVSFEMESCQDCQQKLLKKIYQEQEQQEEKQRQQNTQRKNLWGWWINGINSEEKNRLIKIGISNDSSSLEAYNLGDLKKILRLEEIAKMNKDTFPSDPIKSIIFFSTWFNPNCAIIINEFDSAERNQETLAKTFLISDTDDSLAARASFFSEQIREINRLSENKVKEYGIKLVIFDPNFSRNLFVLKVEMGLNIGEVNSKSLSIMRNLNSDYPICAVLENTSQSFNLLNKWNIEGVKGFKLSFDKHKPSQYIKPLDIIRVENLGYSHVGIYLGKDNYGNHKIAQVSKSNNRAEITDWNELFSANSSSISYYRSFLPYKKPELIKKHISRATSSKDYQGNYGLLLGASNYKHGNCQHFVNRCVLGLNISNEGTLFKKGRELREEIQRTNSHFDNLTIKDCNELNNNLINIESYGQSIEQRSNEDKFNRYIQLMPKSDCNIQ